MTPERDRVARPRAFYCVPPGERMARVIVAATLALVAACERTEPPAPAAPQDAAQAVVDRVQRQLEARPDTTTALASADGRLSN